MLVVLPQGPGHARQGGQEEAIDGDQLRQRSVLGQRQLRAQLGSQRGQHLVQQRGVEDGGRFTQGTKDVEWTPRRSCTLARVVVCWRPRKLVTTGLKKYSNSKLAY